ncbi:MAG: hypothetical protein JWO74_5031 [Solirubrobacterales bacterium]|nr:hypothetical protein [Solirubrobacterales bacterium]
MATARYRNSHPSAIGAQRPWGISEPAKGAASDRSATPGAIGVYCCLELAPAIVGGSVDVAGDQCARELALVDPQYGSQPRPDVPPGERSLPAHANMCSLCRPRVLRTRFRRALESGNLTAVRMAALELPYVNLADALAICLLMRRQ